VNVQQLITRLAFSRGSFDHVTVTSALTKLDASIRRHVRMQETALAAELGLDGSHLGRLLRQHTGLGFREWRRVLAMLHAVPQLVHADRHIAQIAYDVGFEHPSQFDREFRWLFGVSPKTLQRLVHGLSQPYIDER